MDDVWRFFTFIPLMRESDYVIFKSLYPNASLPLRYDDYFEEMNAKLDRSKKAGRHPKFQFFTHQDYLEHMENAQAEFGTKMRLR